MPDDNTPQYTNTDLVNSVLGAVGAVQDAHATIVDAHATLVDGVRKLEEETTIRQEAGEAHNSDIDAHAQLGSHFVANDEIWLTVSGTWEAPVTGWYDVWLIGGGGGSSYARDGDIRKVWSGSSGSYLFTLKYFAAGDIVDVTIGAAGKGHNDYKDGATGWSHGFPTTTTFGDVSSADEGKFAFPTKCVIGVPNQNGTAVCFCSGVGFGGGNYNGNGWFYGGSGGALVCYYGGSHTEVVNLWDGFQGAVRLRFWNPEKASGPAAPLAARKRMARKVVAPATVNLYDPATGNGTVWSEADAEVKLAEGLITEEAWLEMRLQKAAETRTAWMSDPTTEAERFESLRIARDSKLAATDHLLATPDYPLTEAQREAITVYRQALRDLPSQEGAPWDGGGELTPWPVKPQL